MQYRELRRCRPAFEQFCARYQRFLPRKDQREYLAPYLLGLLGPLERKSIEPIALEQEVDVRLLQHFIAASPWDERSMLAEHRRHVRETMGSPNAVLILDPTTFPKRGDKSVGVQHQWCGERGKQDNCVAGINLSYACETGHTFLDRRLYLPRSWASDMPRRRTAGVPDDVVFRPDWQLSFEMVRDARAEGIPHSWLTGDEQFGKSPPLHDWLDELGERYIFELPVRARVWLTLPKRPIRGPIGLLERLAHLRPGRPKLMRVDEIAEALPERAWTPLYLRDASKGPIVVQAVALRVRFQREDPERRPEGWIMLSETLDQKRERKFFASNSQANCSLASMASAAYSRWPIEQDHGQGKNETGLGDYETRTWRGWHHHSALSFLAHHFLVTQRNRLGEKIPGDDGRGDAPGGHGHVPAKRQVAGASRGSHGVPPAPQPGRASEPLEGSARSPRATRGARSRRRGTRQGDHNSKLNGDFT
jgi:SRSO17 transposase